MCEEKEIIKKPWILTEEQIREETRQAMLHLRELQKQLAVDRVKKDSVNVND